MYLSSRYNDALESFNDMKRFFTIFSSEKTDCKNYVYSNCMFISTSGGQVDK